MATTRGAAFIALAAAAMLVLVGCVPSDPMPTPTQSRSGSPTPSPSPTPRLNPAGSAEDNFEYWEYVIGKIHAEYGMTDPVAIMQLMRNYGFDTADVEMTPEITAIGEIVDSVIFSVRFNGECLIGQLFPTKWAVSRAPILGTGNCLIGTTRPIDFSF
jgi:hypothetical protein